MAAIADPGSGAAAEEEPPAKRGSEHCFLAEDEPGHHHEHGKGVVVTAADRAGRNTLIESGGQLSFNGVKGASDTPSDSCGVGPACRRRYRRYRRYRRRWPPHARKR